MTPDQHQRAEDLFSELVDLPPASRATALALEGDPEVRAEVESLLRYTGGETGVLKNAVGQMISAATDAGAFDSRTVGPGARFGHYRIERKLGQGGLGDVYEAVRDDDFHKRVALKIVQAASLGVYPLARRSSLPRCHDLCDWIQRR